MLRRSVDTKAPAAMLQEAARAGVRMEQAKQARDIDEFIAARAIVDVMEALLVDTLHYMTAEQYVAALGIVASDVIPTLEANAQ